MKAVERLPFKNLKIFSNDSWYFHRVRQFNHVGEIKIIDLIITLLLLLNIKQHFT